MKVTMFYLKVLIWNQILLLLIVKIATQTSEVHQESSKILKIQENSSLYLDCQISTPFKTCQFEHGSRNCHFGTTWNSNFPELNSFNCENLDQVTIYHRDDTYFCGIHLENITESESGIWSCILQDFQGQESVTKIKVELISKSEENYSESPLDIAQNVTQTFENVQISNDLIDIKNWMIPIGLISFLALIGFLIFYLVYTKKCQKKPKNIECFTISKDYIPDTTKIPRIFDAEWIMPK